jgi:hypothetical protein
LFLVILTFLATDFFVFILGIKLSLSAGSLIASFEIYYLFIRQSALLSH